MRRFIVQKNIERYRQRLAAETDEARRCVLAKLLAEEEAIWASLADMDARETPPQTLL